MDSSGAETPLAAAVVPSASASTVLNSPITQFPLFSSLPTELRVAIWDWALELQRGDRKIGTSREGVVKPFKSLQCPLFAVSVESRAEALRWYPYPLPVYRCDCGLQSPMRLRAGLVQIDWIKDAIWLDSMSVLDSHIQRGLFLNRARAAGGLHTYTSEPAESLHIKAPDLWIWTMRRASDGHEYYSFVIFVSALKMRELQVTIQELTQP